MSEQIHKIRMADAGPRERAQAMRYYERHRAAEADWREGEPVYMWYDHEFAMCIQYESGKWWHYLASDRW